MKRRGVRLLFLILLAHPLAAQSELWEKAASLAALGESYLAGSMFSVMEELDRDGSVKSRTETTTRLTYDASGKLERTEIVRAIRDGKDVTEEMRKDAARSRSGGGAAFAGWNGMMWSEDIRKKTRLIPGASWVLRGGRKTGLIPFEMEMGAMGKMKGEAEIDAESAVPSIIRVTAGFPMTKDLGFTMEYSPLPSGGFVLSRMSFAGTIVLLLKRSSFRGTLELGDYARPPGELE